MWHYPTVIAHRGGGSLAPENTLAGFECADRFGFKAVEFDVMLTQDGVPVVIHDETLGRTVSGKGLVAETPSDILFQLDAGSWFSPQFSFCRVPSYLQVLSFCVEHDIGMNVEIKPAHGFDVQTGTIVGAITQQFCQKTTLNYAPRILFSSFSIEALQAAQQAAPNISCAVLFEKIPSHWLSVAQSVNAIAVHANHRYLTKKQAFEVRKNGLNLACYTVNDTACAKLLKSWGVNAWFTDRLDITW